MERMPLGFGTAGVLRVSALAEMYPSAILSSNVLELAGYPDMVCWNGSFLSGGPDVVWAWAICPHDSQHPGERLADQLKWLIAELGVQALPGPAFPNVGKGEDLISDRPISVWSSDSHLGIELYDSGPREETSNELFLHSQAAKQVASRKNLEADRYLAGRYPAVFGYNRPAKP